MAKCLAGGGGEGGGGGGRGGVNLHNLHVT